MKLKAIDKINYTNANMEVVKADPGDPFEVKDAVEAQSLIDIKAAISLEDAKVSAPKPTTP